MTIFCFWADRLLGCPDFKTQNQAAYFLVALSYQLGLPPPGFTPELDQDEQQTVERKVREFIQQRGLAPASIVGDIA